MKLVGIVGSNSEQSYNRLLLQYIQKNYVSLFELELLEIKDVPMFNQSDDQTKSAVIQNLNQKITEADGVIIATPEHNHTIPAALKSVLEWLSFKIHPLENKPVMIVGASYYDQGSSRAQLHLRQILNAPGIHAMVMPGNEFLLGKVKTAFDQADNLVDEKTKLLLEGTLKKFLKYIDVLSVLNEVETVKDETEDLFATQAIATTVTGIDPKSENWLKEAAEHVQAVEGNTYVKLANGLLTVDQLNSLLASLPMEISYTDSNNQFLFYNATNKAEMLASRKVSQVGNSLADCHPEKAYPQIEWLLQQLRSGREQAICSHVPSANLDSYNVHHYQAMYDRQNEYVGVNEMVTDIKPLVEWYLKETNQMLVGNSDAISSSTIKDEDVDGTSGASEKVE